LIELNTADLSEYADWLEPQCPALPSTSARGVEQGPIRMSCGLKMAFPSRQVFDTWVWSGPFDNISSEVAPGGAPLFTTRLRLRWMVEHAAHQPDRSCCTLFLGEHQFYAFKTARKPVASCSMSAELRASGEWIVLLSIAGTCEDVRARIAVPVFRQVKL
jgi:hypothetical protein